MSNKRFKHHKKRNTAFLYESLLREGTKATLEKDFDKLKTIKTFIVRAFHPETELGKELALYKALDNPSIDKNISERYLQEVKDRHAKLDKRLLFNEQTYLINRINKSVGAHIYNNFVPNYKNLATIFQIFNDSTPIQEKILLEQSILSTFNCLNENKELKPIDNIVFKTFAKKFNDKYSNLLSEQKDLLTKYVSSFADEGLELKIYLNEELNRLNEKVNTALTCEEIKNDNYMEQKTKKVLALLKEFKSNKEISPAMLENVLKIQQFVYEVEN